MAVRVFSPEILELGEASTSIKSTLKQLAQSVKERPGFTEGGRVSRQESLDEKEDSEGLIGFARSLVKEFFGVSPQKNSSVTCSVLTDPQRFRRHTRDHKIASFWHQDFVTTENGFFFAPDNTARLILTTEKGPLYMAGEVALADPLKVDELMAKRIDKRKIVDLAPVVLGNDGVLLKSEPDPIGGEVISAPPERIFLLPGTTIHRTDPVLPAGRIFFQVDVIMS